MRGEQEVEAVPQRPRRIYFGQMPRSSVNIDKEIPTEGFRGCMHHFQVSSTLQSGASGCEQDFAKCFLKVLHAYFCSTAAAVQPNGLWKSQKTFYKTYFTTCCPRLYIHTMLEVC